MVFAGSLQTTSCPGLRVAVYYGLLHIGGYKLQNAKAATVSKTLSRKNHVAQLDWGPASLYSSKFGVEGNAACARVLVISANAI